MTQAPATGLWGCPSDYPEDFVTIEYLRAIMGKSRAKVLREYRKRMAVKNFALDLAHDLDARGLVLRSWGDMARFWSNGFNEGRRFERDKGGSSMPLRPAPPEPAYTANADLVTGGE